MMTMMTMKMIVMMKVVMLVVDDDNNDDGDDSDNEDEIMKTRIKIMKIRKKWNFNLKWKQRYWEEFEWGRTGYEIEWLWE